MTRLSLSLIDADTLSSLARYALKDNIADSSRQAVLHREQVDRLLKILETGQHSVAFRVGQLMLGAPVQNEVDERLKTIADDLKKRARKELKEGKSSREERRRRRFSRLRSRVTETV